MNQQLPQRGAHFGDRATPDRDDQPAVTIDPHLPPGGCVLITDSGTLEIGADAQLEAFRRAIERNALECGSTSHTTQVT